jgi:hypothetical protein
MNSFSPLMIKVPKHVFCTNKEEDKCAYGQLWNQKFEVFKKIVDPDPNLAYLKNCTFFVCHRNHHLFSWMGYI